MKAATCSALSIFNLCTNNKQLDESVESSMSQQNQVRETLERVQIRNNKNSYVLSHEMKEKETQKKLQKVTEVVGKHFRSLEVVLKEIKGVLAHLSLFNDHLTRSMLLLQQNRDYIPYLGTLYTHVKADFYANEVAFFHNLFTPHLHVTPQFLPSIQLAILAKKLAAQEAIFTRISWFRRCLFSPEASLLSLDFH